MNAAGIVIVSFLVVGCSSRPKSAANPSSSAPDGDSEEWTEGEVDGNDPNGTPAMTPPESPQHGGKSSSRLPPDMQAILDSHNRVRVQHCAQPLAWSTKLAASAQAWADSLRGKGSGAKDCAFEHSQTKYGENLAAGSPGALDAEGVTAMWYEEIAKYNFKRHGFSMETGHFTQVVWRQTSQIGCGKSTCSNGMEIWVCQYDPPGNIHSQFPANVLPNGCK